mgnify:FL=1
MLKNKKMILILFFIGISLIYYTIVHSVNISNRLIGTYQCEESIRLSMIFDSDHSFYISDYENNVFKKGTVEKQTEHIYFLSNDEREENYLQNQSITYQKMSFEVIINQKKLKFKKISDVPIFTPEIEILLEK